MKVGFEQDRARLQPTNDGTHTRGSSATPPGIEPFVLILLFRLNTHHSAPDKKVTVVKDGHAFIHDLMNWRSQALAESDEPWSDRVGSGKERSRGAGGDSGKLLWGNVNEKGGGVMGLAKRSWSTVVKGATLDEAETGTQFSVCKFENLGSMDSMCWYRICELVSFNKNIHQRAVTSCVPRRLWPNQSLNAKQMDRTLRRLTSTTFP